MNFEHLTLENIRTVFHYRPDTVRWTASKRRYHIIGIHISGVTLHDLGYKHLNIAPDYIYFFNQRDDYTAHVLEFGECYSIHFTTTEEIETESFCKKVSNTEEIIKIIGQVEAAWLQRDRHSLRMKAEFYQLCDLFYSIYTSPYHPSDNRILYSKEYIDLHFKEKNCLSEAVAHSGVTQRRFCDIFKAHFQVTPAFYIVSKKIECAKELLELEYLSTSEIAELSGFSDVYYFSKAFKQKTGTTPSAYRASLRL
ncbi:MAG: helix-turn-helix transcriptional regulator [Clostridia bacterium]|nr:helix-turn-helix transcriptional regulator [Clostridia bacterium]